MNLKQILAELQAHRQQINRAITALQRQGSQPGTRATSPDRRRGPASAATRKRISEGMRRRWAERKKAS
ncbi:MAG: hypothetical protein JO041_13265 [Acidobacteria bacterium]|nr:hypothetical protein [Acidobacteriota bacterium]